MQRRNMIIATAILIGAIGSYLFQPESLFVNTTVNELALLIVGAL